MSWTKKFHLGESIKHLAKYFNAITNYFEWTRDDPRIYRVLCWREAASQSPT